MKLNSEKSQNRHRAASHRSESNRVSAFQLVDNRPEAMQMKRLQEMANDSLKTKQAASLQAIAAHTQEKEKHRQLTVTSLKSHNADHVKQCQCASCSGVSQLKGELAQKASLTNTAGGDRSTQQNVAQLKCKECGRSSGHRNDCSRHKSNLRAKEEERTEVHQESQSILNLYSYDSQWANKNGITEKMVKDFVKSYGKINGHATSRGDTDAKRHENTTKDINAFHSWYNQNKDDY